MSMNEAFCPECGTRLKLGTHPYKGQRVLCSGCETNLILVSLEPLELEVAMLSSRAERKKHHTVNVACPECEAPIRLNIRVREGQEFVCENCDTLLEIISTDPLELDVALMINMKNHRWQKSRQQRDVESDF